ncbi:IS481 family transposase, partial [candidate division KSB1 bacterium]|nr:IS481 family transposase [candidate division KSB1 bacterium]NIU92499.1 IS481 family transposase [candidate division KSB1 bacterium]NIV70039.1 IS481 family transposase [Phycisphaerae bacterium]NIW20642.1 IS481 family transposase [candidate division KSB1 bacterium]NIX72596.1 IS481 family transposase [candidate division KSB1 bacterium]
CRQFGISRKTGYKFLQRYLEVGEPALQDRSRRPQSSPNKTAKEIEALILQLRQEHPVWGARKLKRRLEDLGYENLPAVSTITAILRRHQRISPESSQKHKRWQRFCAKAPNELWQMDFKGRFPAKEGHCHPLTILDDHSRYCLCLAACHNEQKQIVQHHLSRVFGYYGMPNAMLMDNGSPWGGDAEHPYTELTVWLLRLGIKVIHSHPYHPQTIGKEERFHRTLKAEAITHCMGQKHRLCQKIFDRWRLVYNTQRPHEALNMNVPAHCYRP